MVIAAVNAALIYVLNSIDGRIDLSSDIVIMAIGGVPFLATAVLITLAIVWAARAHRQLASTILIVGGVGLPFMVVGGLWAGFGATFFAQPGSRAATALAVYQFTFAAAILADAVTLVAAVVTLALAARARGRLGRDASGAPPSTSTR